MAINGSKGLTTTAMSIRVIAINLIIEKQIVRTNASAEKRTQENCCEIFHLSVLLCRSLLRNCGLLNLF